MNATLERIYKAVDLRLDADLREVALRVEVATEDWNKRQEAVAILRSVLHHTWDHDCKRVLELLGAGAPPPERVTPHAPDWVFFYILEGYDIRHQAPGSIPSPDVRYTYGNGMTAVRWQVERRFVDRLYEWWSQVEKNTELALADQADKLGGVA